MSLATYSDLKTKAASWFRRAGQATYVAEVPDFVTLGEARLNRELGPVETDTTITGTPDSRRIDVSAVSVVAPVALFLAETGMDEREVQFKADGSFPYLATSGKPSFAAMDGNNAYIDFDRPLDSAYPFRLRSQNRFALSDSVTTNWLLTNHPDVYLAATLMWGGGYLEQWANGAVWKNILDETIPEIRNVLARSRKGIATVDRALLSTAGGMSMSTWANG